MHKRCCILELMIKRVHRHLHLQHVRHTGRILHASHTSYRALLILVFVGVGFMSWLNYYATVKADDLQVTARRNAAMPATIPFISSHVTGFETRDNRIEIFGTCPTNVSNYVKIFNWSRLIATVPCSQDGTFKTKIWIVYGNNRIQASSVNITGQETNRSVVTVIKRTRPVAAPSPKNSTQVITGVGFDGLDFDRSDLVNLMVDRGLIVYTVGEEFGWNLSVRSGTSPYDVTIQWGDDTESTYKIADSTEFTAKHVYKNKGTYDVVVAIKDAEGREVSYSYVATTPVLQTGLSQNTNRSNSAFAVFASGSVSDQTLLYVTYGLVGLFVLSLTQLPVVHTDITRHKYHRHRHG